MDMDCCKISKNVIPAKAGIQTELSGLPGQTGQ